MPQELNTEPDITVHTTMQTVPPPASTESTTPDSRTTNIGENSSDADNARTYPSVLEIQLKGMNLPGNF